MESFGEKPEVPVPIDNPEAAESAPAIEVIGLKEALRMLAEIHASDEEVLDVLQNVINQPEPDLSDPEAREEYLENIKFAHNIARNLSAKTDRTTQIMAEIRERITQFQNPS